MTDTPQDVHVQLDDRIRLLSALLTITDWPEKAQERHPHGTHAHSRATRKALEPFREHAAVRTLQGLLDQGTPLESLFGLVLHLNWPGLDAPELPRWAPMGWNVQLWDVYGEANLAQWWHDEAGPWQAAFHQAEKVFQGVAFKPFLKPFVGEIAESFVLAPNISVPTDEEICVRSGNDLICITPPRLAWGDSPPWPFDEDAGYIRRVALSQYLRVLFQAYLHRNSEKLAQADQSPLPVSDAFRARFPAWIDQFSYLFMAAAAALYLEHHVSVVEANAYVLMERKTQGTSTLPAMISVMRRYLGEYEKGRFDSLIDFLPVFTKQLRVAARIVNL